jgi:hypothetical protein
MTKPEHTAKIVQFPAHRVVRRDGVAVPSPKSSFAANARTAPSPDIDFSSWYHFAAIKDQDRTGR